MSEAELSIPAPDPAIPAGPTCSACGQAALVQWQRRGGPDPAGTEPVFGCAAHAITLAAAAQVHQPDCPAPDPARLPACGCTPEPLPPQEPMVPETTTLPTGWVVPAT